MRADYQLKHSLFGRQGSLWEQQTTEKTRNQLRGVVRLSGNHSTLTSLDEVAAGAVNEPEVLRENEYFPFIDGNFVVIGRHQRDYSHHSIEIADVGRVYVGYRGSNINSSALGIPTRLARVAVDFVNSVNMDAYDLPLDRDWYLIPIPHTLNPLVIQGRENDSFLVQGIDFIARSGYIAMFDSPANVLPFGSVRVLSSYKHVRPHNPFLLSAPAEYIGGRYLAEYAYRTQSIDAFKRAAAEYAGLYVFQTPDVVLEVIETSPDETVYVTANAGAVVIKYPHEKMTEGMTISPGHIVSGTFEIISSKKNSEINIKKSAVSEWTEDISLDGVLAVKGLSWSPNDKVEVTATEFDVDTGKPHVRFMLNGEAEDLADFWEASRLHEVQTGEFIHDGLGNPTLTSSVNMWDLLEDFYGLRYALVLADHHTPVINARLRIFLREFRPASCLLLTSLKADLPVGGALTNDRGDYLVGEDGEYIPYEEAGCVTSYFTYDQFMLAYDEDTVFTLEVCGD